MSKDRAVPRAQGDDFVVAVGRALRRAAKVARKTAQMHGTPVAIMKDGKIVLEKP